MKTKFFFAFVFFIFFSFCKKKECPKAVIEKVPPKFALNLYTQLDYIKTPSGYDTIIGLSSGLTEYFDDLPNFILGMGISSAFCNSTDLFNFPLNPTNKLAIISPSSNWQINSTETGLINYNDLSPLPTFTNSNWWTADSIDRSQDFVIDFSSFKNYTQIYLELQSINFSYQPYIINFPTNQITISGFPYNYSFSQPITIDIWVNKNEQQLSGNKKINITKALHFQIATKIYNYL